MDAPADESLHQVHRIAFVCLFVWVEALIPSLQFFSHVGMFSWVEPVLSNEDEVSCSRTQHRAPGEIQTFDLAITLPTELSVLPGLVLSCSCSFY